MKVPHSIQDTGDIGDVDFPESPSLCGFTDPVTGIRVEMVDVTPELATAWLKMNTHNRNLREKHVRALMRAMRLGNWRLTGDAIAFSWDEVLVNGQHRLEAIRRTGTIQRLLVVYGLTLDDQRAMDAGARRGFGDDLSLMGESNTLLLAGVVTKCFLWDSGYYRFEQRNFYPSREELYSYFLGNTHTMRECARVAGQVRNSFVGLVPPSILGLAWYLFWDIDQDDCEYFFSRLRDGAGLEENHPILTLRKRLFAERTRIANLRLPASYWIAFFIKTWNAMRRDVPLLQLKFKPGGKNPESMPMPDGYVPPQDKSTK